MPFMTGHRPIRGGMRKHVRWSAGSLSALLFFFAALAASPSVSVAQQSSSAPNGGTLRITGEVSHPIVTNGGNTVTVTGFRFRHSPNLVN